MNDLDNQAFVQLFKDACEKCFGHPVTTTLTETESKLFCNTIIDKTGLIIGFKSIKNYSAYALNESPGKQENPSVATMDTLARYIVEAPYTDEVKRKAYESHYPYWFAYKDKFYRSTVAGTIAVTPVKKKPPVSILVAPVIVLVLLFSIWRFTRNTKPQAFTDTFTTTNEDSLTANGWFINNKDTTFWRSRNKGAHGLNLYTLKGDNWPDTVHTQGIKNLLVRELPGDCFTAEVHLEKFIPHQNWQQAGLLLMEDTLFTGKSMRLSLAYNDYTGGLPISKQVIIQAITSLGSNFTKPEEIAHTTLFYLDSAAKNPAILDNLNNSALRIEKHGKQYRMLYSDGVYTNGAFKEITAREFDMQPKYIAIFALKGFVDSAENMPVKFTFFKLTTEDCEK